MSKIYFVEIVTPAAPSVGKVLLYAKPDGFLYSLDDAGVETKLSNSPDTGITDLSGDVTASGPGFAVATLASVGTSGTYTKVTTDVKGRITSGTTLSSGDIPNNAANTSGSSGSFTGSLVGDVTGTQGATVVSGLTLKVDKAFTPTTPTDWSLAPTTVQQAIDTLAANQKSNIDGGTPVSVFGGTFNIDGGSP